MINLAGENLAPKFGTIEKTDLKILGKILGNQILGKIFIRVRRR